jgi:dihydrofolate reductase
MMPQGIEVIGIAAQTLDGFIARDESQVSTEWTSQEDKHLFRKVTRDAGALILGRKTFDTFGGRPLPGRKHFVLTSKPEDQPVSHPLVQFMNATPNMVLHEAEVLGYRRIFVAGGASIYRQFLDEKLLDELWLTIEPIILGDGISMFQGLINKPPRCERLSNMGLNPDTVQLKYKLYYE